MLTIKIDIDVSTEEEAQLTLEHIARNIGGGYKAGEGWNIEGEPTEEEHD